MQKFIEKCKNYLQISKINSIFVAEKYNWSIYLWGNARKNIIIII